MKTENVQQNSKEEDKYNSTSLVKAAKLLNSTDTIIPFEPIRGLYYLPNLIDHETEIEWMKKISDLNFSPEELNNQLMFFSSVDPSATKRDEEVHKYTNWPRFLVQLIRRLPGLIQTANPGNLDQINGRLFGPDKLVLPWQVIVNVYRPGQGITPHVDLIDRFDEVVVGISLGSSVAMQFEPVGPHAQDRIQRLYLQRRSGYILSNDARYRWTHGILSNQLHDWVCDSANHDRWKILRTRSRVSITVRRLKLGANLLYY